MQSFFERFWHLALVNTARSAMESVVNPVHLALTQTPMLLQAQRTALKLRFHGIRFLMTAAIVVIPNLLPSLTQQARQGMAAVPGFTDSL